MTHEPHAQLALLADTIAASEPKPKRQRQRRGYRGYIKQSDGDATPHDQRPEGPLDQFACQGEPGPCAHVGCPRNLTLDVTEAGSIKIPGYAGRPGLIIPVRRGSDKTIDTEDLLERAAELVQRRIAWLVALAGSNCAAHVVRQHGPLTQQQVGLLLEMPRQRVEQIEQGAMAHAKYAADRLYRIRPPAPAVQIRRKEKG
jgi:hypothetical protein